jgi:hypothetical protein
MRNAAKVGDPVVTDYVTAVVIIMAITFGPVVLWMLGR